jgi:hypothetical protein
VPLNGGAPQAPTGTTGSKAFRIRPAYGTPHLLIELCGDHRAPDYPDVALLLEAALGARQRPHPPGATTIMTATDEYFSTWSYAGGCYRIDDDVGGYFITVPDGNPAVIADLERALVAGGRFVRVDVPD